MPDSNTRAEREYDGGKFLTNAEEDALEAKKASVVSDLLKGLKLEIRGCTFSLWEDIDYVDDVYIGHLVDCDVSVWQEFIDGRLPAESMKAIDDHIEFLANSYMDNYTVGADHE